MLYLFPEMLILHILAFLIGVLIAWAIWGRTASD